MKKRISFDANKEVWDVIDMLWSEKLDVTLKYLETDYCCDLLNSYNTTFCAKSKTGGPIRVWFKGKSRLVNSASISVETLNLVSVFSKCYHTIGNIMPLPVKLNSPFGGRANKWTMADYADNYLNFVKTICNKDIKSKYYLKLDKKSKEYFGKFVDFNDYIESNFLQPFFTDSKYENIKQLDFRSAYSGEELMKRYINQATQIIKERERLILKAIEMKMGSSDDYIKYSIEYIGNGDV